MSFKKGSIMKHLEERIEIEKKYGRNILLVTSLDGKEREYLYSKGYKCKSIEPTHCEISW